MLLRHVVFTCSIIQKVERVELDLQYVAEHARGAVDITFVMDVSDSIDGEEYSQSKIFVKGQLHRTCISRYMYGLELIMAI